MGGSVSTVEHSIPGLEHGGKYTVTHKNHQVVFSWGKKKHGVEIVVSRENQAVAATLTRHNVSKNKKRHFNPKRHGYLDILIENGIVRINDKYSRRHCYGSTALNRTIFAAMRIYAPNTGQCIRSAIVEISSSHAKALYHCYVKAFRKNGFETSEKEPVNNHVSNYIIIFTRYVYKEPQLSF